MPVRFVTDDNHEDMTLWKAAYEQKKVMIMTKEWKINNSIFILEYYNPGSYSEKHSSFWLID